MDEEGRPATGQGKEEEGDYVRNRNRTIARNLCIILDINVSGDIFKIVLELVYFKEEALLQDKAILQTHIYCNLQISNFSKPCTCDPFCIAFFESFAISNSLHVYLRNIMENSAFSSFATIF
jgi:hypothetical protein